MANGGRIDFTVGYKLDKTGLNEIQQSLVKIQAMTSKDLMNLDKSLNTTQAVAKLNEAKNAANAVSKALQKSFSFELNNLNVQKFTSEIVKSQGSVENLYSKLRQAGIEGNKTASALTKQILTTNTALHKSETVLDKIGTTLKNTLRWSISSSLINTFTGAFQQAYGYVQHLDTSLNDIRIVTGKSADEMERFGRQANEAAKALGKATTDYTEASLIFYQQGLSDKEVQARAETTLKAANVTGQSTKAVSEQLTAVWNGYQVSAENTEEAVDKLAAVAATTAADLEELSTGMSKVAAAASTMGVDMDQLNATLATIESVTRQAPESVGTALKTIYARMGDLKLGESDEDGLKLGDVSSNLEKVGINILDVNGELRDMGVIVEEIGEKWNTWTKAQQTAVAESVAGKRQYNNLFALFDNWDMYLEALETSRNSTGTLQEQQDIYMESTSAHIQKLKTQWEDLYDSVLDTQDINNVLDSFTKILNVITKIVDSLGGGKTILMTVATLVAQIASKGLAKDLTSMINNVNQSQAFIKDAFARIDYANLMGDRTDEASQKMKEATLLYGDLIQFMNEEQIVSAREATARIGDLTDERIAIENVVDALKKKNVELDVQNDNIKQSVQLEKEAAAKEVKRIEAAMGARNFQNDTHTGARRSDISSGLNIFEIIDQWSSPNSKYKDVIKSIQEDLSRLNIISEGTIKTVSKFNKLDLSKAGGWNEKDLAKAPELIKDLKVQLEDLYKSGNIGEKQFQKLSQVLDNSLIADGSRIKKTMVQPVTQAFKEIGEIASQTSDKVKGVQTALNLSETGTKQQTDEINKNTQAREDNANAIKEQEARIEEIKNAEIAEMEALKVQLNPVILEARINAYMKMGQSVMSLTTAYSMLTNGLKGFANGELSAAQAFTTLMSTTLMSIRGIKNLKSAYQDMVIVLKNKITAEIEETGVIKNKAVAEQMANVEAKNTIKTFSAVTLGIMATVIVIRQIIQYYKKLDEQLKETNNNIIKTINTSQEEIDKNIELIKSYRDLITQYKEGSISVEDFNDKRKELLSTTDLEIRKALEVAESWESASKALDNYASSQYTKTIEEQEEKRNKALENAFLEMKAGSGYLTNEGRTFNLDQNSSIGALYEYVDEYNAQYFKALEEIGAGYFALDDEGKQVFKINLQIDANEEGLKTIKVLEDLQKQYEASGKNTSIYQDIQKNLQQLYDSENYQDIKDAIAAMNEAYIGDAAIKSAIDYAQTLDQVTEAQKRFFEAMENSGLTTEEIFRAWDKTLNESNSDIAKQQAEINANAAFMIQSWMTGFGNVGGDVFNSQKWQKALDISKMLEEAGLSEGITLLDESAWEKLFGLSDSEIQDAVSTAIANKAIYDLKEAKDKFKETIEETSTGLGDVISKAISGELTNEDEGYQALIQQFDILKQIIPELTDEIEVFNNEGLIGTEHWTNAVYKLQSSIDKLEYDKLIETRAEAFDKLQLAAFGSETSYDDRGFLTSIAIEPDDSAFQEAMDDIMNAEYSIDVEVHSDVERDFTQLVDSLEQADNMASKIGEDFIVAADDIRDLNNAFPGILEGIEYLGDGTVKLNEEIVQSAMNAATQEEEADTQKTIAKLQNAATELRAKAETYEAMADIAHKAASQEIDSEQAKTDITAKLNELESENDQIAANTEIDNAIAVADNSQVNAGINADNWTKSYEQAAAASYEFAQAAVANAAAAAAGPNGVPQNPQNFGFTYQGNAGEKASEAHKGQFKTTADGSIDWNATEQVYRDMAEAARARANDIEGMMVGAAAKATEVLQNNADAKAGRPKKESGGGSGKEAKQEKYLEREEDIYRTINEELDQIESTLGRIQTINDHEWGIDAQKTLEVENELLDKQLEKLEEKRALQEKDLSIRRKQLEYEGVVFSEDGSAMLNAEGQLNALYAHYNTMVDTYNALSAAEQETYKNQLDAEKDRIDKIEKKIDEYESGFSDYQSTLDELLDAHYAEIENEIKLFNNMVDVHLELNDAEKEWDDFWYDVIQDVQDTDFGGQIAKSMAKLETLVGTTINNTDSDVSVLTNHLLDTIAEVQAQIASANRGGEDSLFGDDTLASKENLENYRDKLMEALKAAKDEIDNISETYLKMLDDAQDKIDDQVDGWNSIGDQIQHDLDLIKLVSGEKAFNAFENFLNQQYQNDLNLINTQKQSKDFWKAEIDRYTQLLEVTDKNTVQWKTYSEALKKASENYKKAVQDLDKTVEEALKHLDEWRTNQVNAISTALDNAMSGGLGLETVEQEWKLINDYADKYLDNVERALDMEEYTNILNEAADAIGLSAANQEKLNRFRDEELKKLNEKEKLTSYDIAESKARLEILKQQMALEDAQRNKSNMRLRRDNQGNYVYQYVSNEEELEKAGQGTLTAKREWYELVKKRWKETSDWIIESEKQQANLLQQIDEAEKNGEIETANKLKELYKLNQQDIVNAYAEAEKNKQDLYLGTAQYFDYVDNAAILPNSKATVRQLVNEWVGGDGQEGFVSAVNTAITKLEETQNKYAARTAVILTEAGIQYQQLKENGVDPTIDSLSEMVDTNEELRYTLDDVNDALRQQENNLYQCEMAYHRLRDAAANAVYAANSALNSLAQTAINTVQRVQAAVQAAQSASRITTSSLMNGSSLGSGSGGSGGYTTGNSYYNKSGKYTAKADIGGTIGVYKTNNGRKTEQITISNLQTKYSPGDFGYTSWDEMFKYNPELKTLLYSNYYNAGNYSSFDTGGYTGAWGNSGKFAMLHQKELVLNQDDTANMLKAVEALREITDNQGSISGIADTILRTSNIQAQALANIGAGLFQQLANMVNTSNTSTTRNMTVNADFSGVRSADAIYQALMELQNYGLQQNYSVDPMSSTPY